MAGYCDEGRSYVGVYSVSYMLNECLKKAEGSQFILAVFHNSFTHPKIKDLKIPYTNFINMFKAQTLLKQENKDKRKKLFDSVAIVVTKAEG